MTKRHNPPATAYVASVWERVTATVCAVGILIVVVIIILRDRPFADPNQVVLVRTILSLAVAIIGAVIPGFLNVDFNGRGIAIRSGGALALFVLTFFFTPKVLPISVSEQTQRAAQEAASGVRRLLTAFQSIYVQAIFELPSDEAAVAALKDSLTAILGHGAPYPDGIGVMYTNGKLQSLKFNLDAAQGSAVVRLSPKLVESGALLEFLRSPRLVIGISRQPQNASAVIDSMLPPGPRPDLYLFVHDRGGVPPGDERNVVLDVMKNRIYVAWNGFDYPKDAWVTSRRITSIEDLGHAQIALMWSASDAADQVMQTVARKAKPVWVNLRFDNNFVTIKEFEETPLRIQFQAHFGMFPSTQDILSGKVSHAFEPGYLGGY